MVTNNGPTDALGVLVTDPLATFLSFNAGASPDCTFNVGTNEVECAIGALTFATGTATVSFTVDIDPSTPVGDIDNTATVSATTNDSTPGNNTADETITVGQNADLSITKTADDTTPFAGGQVTYTIVVTNNGPTDALGVLVTDPLATFLSFNAGASPDCTFNVGTNEVECAIGALTFATGTATVSFTVDIDPSTPGLENIINIATVSATTNDDNPGNDTATETITVGLVANLVITKSVNIPNPDELQIITYTISVKNLGPSDVTNPIADDNAEILPDPSITLINELQVEIDQGFFDTSTGIWTMGPLPADGIERFLMYRATVDAGTAGDIITNTMTITSEAEDNILPNEDSGDQLQIPPVDGGSRGVYHRQYGVLCLCLHRAV